MARYEVRKQIGKNDVGIRLLFNNYSASAFKNDIEEIIKYQSKKGFSEDKDERARELDLKFYKGFDESKLRDIKTKKSKISYEFFKQKSLEIFSKFMFDVLTERKFLKGTWEENGSSLITSTEFTIQFKVLEVEDREYYFAYNDDSFRTSDPENACFIMSGFWLLQQIVVPSILGTSNFAIIQRYMLHELTHHSDKMLEYDYFNQKYEDKIKKFYQKKSAFFLNCLYTTLFNLREEGLPDFNARKNSDKIDINMSGVRKYNENLIKLSTLTKKRESEPFYENEIGFGNLTPSNEYTMGRNMCLTIAMGLSKEFEKRAKEMNKLYIPYSIIVKNEKISSNEINLNSLLGNSNIPVIYIANLDKDAINGAIEVIKPTAHYKFIQLYEDACNHLGIEEKNMIITRRRFYGIVSNSIDRMKKEKIARLNGNGFEYSEKEIKPL